MPKKIDYATLIKNQIKNYHQKITFSEIGEVLSVGDGIAIVNGLDDALFGELIKFENDEKGIIFSLHDDLIGVVLLSQNSSIKEGTKVKRTKKIISIPTGDHLLGRVIDGLGNPLDDLGPIEIKNETNIFQNAPSVMARKEVNQPFKTGILAVDAMIPIGKGQRELIIGDRQTGKTAIALDSILNQKGKNVYCIYVGIGQKNSTIAQIIQKLKKHNALKYTTIVSSSASDSIALQYISPYSGVTIAENWMKKGKDVLIVYDDLSKHAIAYRTISLLLRFPPGREAYPGDVFFLHAKLLERAGRLNEKHGSGSITALPIVETQNGDISAYIPTNIISITDGQIFTQVDLFNAGQMPAIDYGFSVSRVGSSAQTSIIKKTSSSLKLELAQYNEMQAFSQFGSELDQTTKDILNHGSKLFELLKQNQYKPFEEYEQSILLIASKHKFIDIIPLNYISKYKEFIIDYFKNDHDSNIIINKIKKEGNLDEKLYQIFAKNIFKITIKFIEQLKIIKKEEIETFIAKRNIK